MAQGYVQAQDRFYEMDVRRHMTSGRLSEMFGKSQVDNDEFLRTSAGTGREEGVRHHAVGLHQEVPPGVRQGGQRLPAGQGRRGHLLEYAALGFANDYKPEKWTPVDSVSWLKAMAWDLRGNMQDEIDRALMTSRLGLKQIEDLYRATRTAEQGDRPGGPVRRAHQDVRAAEHSGTGQARGQPQEPVPAPARPRAAPRAPRPPRHHSLRASSGLYKVLDDLPTAVGVNGNGIGSNSWVVGGSTPSPASRCWPTTRTCRPRCRPSGTRWACTAAPSPASASTTSPATPSRACPA